MAEDFQKYRNKALNLLKYRPRSVGEIRQRLEKAGAEKQIIQQVTDSLLEHGLLDDLEFTQWLVDSRANYKKRGLKAIRAELRTFGIEKQIAAQVIQSVSQEALVKAAVSLLENKMNKLLSLEPYEQKQKAYHYLARRGYSYPVISAAIDEWQTAA